MKRSIQLLCAIVTIAVSNVAYGWDYTFINNSDKKIGVRIKLQGRNEPWYYGTIEANDGKSYGLGPKYKFEFGINKQANLDLEGTKKEYTGRKVGFCLGKISVMRYEGLQPTNVWTEYPDAVGSLSPLADPFWLCSNVSFIVYEDSVQRKSNPK